MKTLNLELLLQLHVLAIKQSGGSEGIRDMGRLESALASQSQEVFGEELYKNIFEKSAAITRAIIADHPFVDGNKRTGMLCGITFIEINGYKTDIPEGMLEDFAVQIAVEKCDVAEIANWFEKNSQKR